MKEFLKKVVAILLAIGFCFTSVPSVANALEVGDVVEVTDPEVPLENYSQEEASEPEGGAGAEEGAPAEGSAYDAQVAENGGGAADTSSAADDTSMASEVVDEIPESPVNEVTEPPVPETPAPVETTEAPIIESPSETTSMIEIDNSLNTQPTYQENTTPEETTTPEESTAATKTFFEYEDPEIYVTATLNEEDALPEDAVFVVKQIFEDSILQQDRDIYNWSNDLLNEYLEKIEMAQVNTFFYDIYFEVEGNRVLLNKEFKVNITYKRDKVLDEDANGSNVRIYHLDDNDMLNRVEAFDTNALVYVNQNGSVTNAELWIARYRYTPLMISMIETKEEHEKRLEEEAAKKAAEEAAASEDATVIYMEDSATEETDTEDAEKETEAEKEPEEEKAPARTYYASLPGSVSATIILTDPSQVPDAAEVLVSPVTPEAEEYNYDAYMDALNDASDGSISYTQENTLLYDIKFVEYITDEAGNVIDQVEYEPTEGTVRVYLRFNQNQLSNEINAEDSANVTVNHLVDDGGAITAEEVNADVQLEGVDRVNFTTESFSVYSFTYTVDFEYEIDGEVFQYSMNGEDSIMLSELIEILGMRNGTDFADAAAYLAEVENVEFSDAALIQITQIDSDWELLSLAPFDTEEALSITMKNGDVVTVKVTDENSYSENLSDFVYGVTINADKEDGKYVIKPGKTYTAHMTFKEDPDGKQFSESGHFEYTFPDGFTPGDTEGTFTIMASSKGVDYPVEGNTYRIRGNKLIVEFNKESPNYKYVSSSGITTINLNIEGLIDINKSSISWGGEIRTDIKPDLDQGVSIQKTITSFNAETGVITYQLKVKSLNGTNENIVVSDHMDGTAVVVNQDVTLSGASMSGPVNYTTLGHGDNHVTGFNFTIPSMGSNEEATVTYTATINKNQLIANNVNLDWDGKNSVTAKPDEPGKPDGDNTDLKHYIAKPTISKSSEVSAVVNGKRTITWTIVATSTAYLSLAGSNITDTIQEGSRDMKFSGNGLKVEVIDENGSKQTRYPSWSEVGVTDKSTAYSWNYPVPSGDTGNKTYIITYTTEVDVSDYASDVTKKNDVSDKYGSTTGEGKVGPEGENHKANIEKNVGTVTAETITWSIDITVPVQGLSTAKLVDVLPAKSDQGYYDTLYGNVNDEGVITITGLRSDERAIKSYTAPNGQAGEVVINFQKFVNEHWQDGLFGGNSTRTITVGLASENNTQWMDAAETATYLREHTNTANFQANQYVITDTATGTPMSSSLDKVAGTPGEKNINGIIMPVYNYTITVTGVSGPFDITDTFDQRLILDGEPTIYGGDQYYQGNEGAELLPQTDTTQNGQIVFHISEENLAKQPGGAYYSHYKISYALIAKDAEALESLKKEAASTVGGRIKLDNNATSPLGNDDAKVVFENKTLTKELVNEAEIGVSTNVGEFRISVNPEGYDLDPNSETITLRDIYSDSLSIDYKTITVEPGEGASWNVSAAEGQNTAVFTLPDETPIVITYQARIIGEGNIHFENTATVRGQEATISETKNVRADMGGTAGNYSILLLKQKEGELSTTLSGAEFELYYANGNAVPNGQGNPLKFTTTKNGVWIEGDQSIDGWSLKADTEYYLWETKAPDGYVLPDAAHRTKYYFTIAKNDIANYSQHIYHSGDTIKISNTPLGGIEIQKSVQGIELDDNQKNAISFTITGPDGFTETKKLSEFTDGKWKLTGLPVGTYTITETCGEIDGYERKTSYSINKQATVPGTEATVEVTDTTSETVVSYINRYKSTVNIEPDTLQLKVQKKWYVGDENKSLDSEFASKTVDITLKRYKALMPTTVFKFYRTIDGEKTKISDAISLPSGAKIFITPEYGTNIRPMHKGASGMYQGAAYDNAKWSNPGIESEFDFSGTEASVIEIWFDNDPGDISISFEGGATVSDESFSEDNEYTGETATITGGGSKTFNNLPLSENVGGSTYVYKYYVVETTMSGFTTQYQVGNGTFADSISKADAIGASGNGNIVIKNTKEAPTTGDLIIKKETSGTTDADSDDIFTFTVALTAPSGETLASSFAARKSTETEDTTVTVVNSQITGITLKANETFTIKGLPAGTGYTVTEAAAPGYTASIPENTGTIADADNSTVTVTATNTRDKGSLIIQKTGTVNGSSDSTGLLNGSYRFTISGKANTSTSGINKEFTITLVNGVATAVTPSEAGADGISARINAGEVTVSGLPTGTYTVSEKTTGLAAKGISLVGNNNLEITVEKNPQTIPTAEFVNNKAVANLKLTKTVVGQNVSTDTSFTFNVTLTAPEGVSFDSSYPTVETDGTSGTKDITSGTAFAVSLKGGESWQINNLPVGTTYRISEGDLPAGWTQTAKTGDSGNLSTAGQTVEAQFTNKYDASGSITILGNKYLRNGNLAENIYNYTIYNGNISGREQLSEATVYGHSQVDDDTIQNWYSSLYGTRGTRGDIPFVFNYKLSDLGNANRKTFVYTIAEDIPEGAQLIPRGKTHAGYYYSNGVYYDPTLYHVSITVEDIGTGKLKVISNNSNNSIEFTNYYEASIAVPLAGTKQFNRPLMNNQFTFKVVDSQNKTVATGTSKSDNSISFSSITYDDAFLQELSSQAEIWTNINTTKSYTELSYYVSEIIPVDAVARDNSELTYSEAVDDGTIEQHQWIKDGIIYDSNVKEVKVRITRTKNTFILFTWYTYDATIDTASDEVEFVNEYYTEVLESLEGMKTLTGAILQNNQFEFSATADSSNPTEGLDTTNFVAAPKNDAEGKIDFGSLKFTKAGTWKYTVRETSTDGSGITVDKSEYEVTFNVDDTAHNGTLTVTKTIKQVKDSTGAVISVENQAQQSNVTIGFENTYSATGEVEFSAQKEFLGGELTGNEFDFEVYQIASPDSTTPMMKLEEDNETPVYRATAKNNASGNVTFTPEKQFTQDDAGTSEDPEEYYFLIKEIIPESKDPSIIYDESSTIVIVSVYDKGDGTLNITKTVRGEEIGENDPDATFVNEKLADFEFTKKWTTNGSSTVVEPWPSNLESITVKLTRTPNGEYEYASKQNAETLTFTATKESLTIQDTGTITEDEVSRISSEVKTVEGAYCYKVSGLKTTWSKEEDGTTYTGGWTYTIEEIPVGNGYNDPKYVDNAGIETTSAESGCTIINDKTSVPLPFTGGTGTTLFTILGGILILGAGAAFLIRGQRRRRKQQ